MRASKDLLKEQIFTRSAELSSAAREPFPNSKKVYVEGKQAGVRVAMREIALSATQTAQGPEHNPAIRVYDTSGPYTDPNIAIDINQGLPPLREKWIEARQDTEILAGISSRYGQERLANKQLDAIRFPHLK